MTTAEALPAVEPADPDHRPLGAGSVRTVVLLVATLTALRLYAAAVLGLSADEAYYWIWAKNLAFGYLDHPPMVAVLIRASISVFGDTEFGLRWLSVLLGAAASLGVWRLVIRLDGGEAAALAGAAMVQATLFLGAGALLVTPDTPLVLFWTLTLLVLVEIGRGGHGAWWLLAGAMVAASFQSKYSAVFLGAGILLWLITVPRLRAWFASPWPYAGGVVALLGMAPVIAWNISYGGASFAKQFGRAVPKAFDPRFVPEFLAGQVALLTPLIAILVAYGLAAAGRAVWRERDWGATLMLATTLPLTLYLVWYGLFDRVQGNWTACLLPACIVIAVMAPRWWPLTARPAAMLAACARWSVVAGVFVGLFVTAHALFRVVPLAIDPTSQLFGWRETVAEIEAVARREQAGSIGTVNYATTGHLRFYGSGTLPMLQLNEPLRYVMEREPDERLLATRPILVAAEQRRAYRAERALVAAYGSVRRIETVERRWRGTAVDRLVLFLVADPRVAGRPDIGFVP